MSTVTMAVIGAFVLLLVIVWLSGLMRARRRAHRELLKREAELRDVVEALRQTEHARARLFDEVVNAEEERVRVADVLHDGPIQQATALALTLDLANLQLDRGDVSALSASVAKARRTAADQMLALRELMIELRPPAYDEIGPEGAPPRRSDSTSRTPKHA